MKTKTLVLTAALWVTAIAAGFAADPMVGSWKLNEAKSKIPPGTARNMTVVYTVAGDSYECVVDGVDASGKPMHNEWTGKFDGKDYAVSGNPLTDARSVKLVTAGHYAITNKKSGKLVDSGTVDISADGKSRTLTTNTTDAAGKKVTVITVFDRQ